MLKQTNVGSPEHRVAELNEIKHLLEELKAFAIKHLNELHGVPLDAFDDEQPIRTLERIDYRTLDFENLKEKWDNAVEILHQIETGQWEDPKEYYTDHYLSEVDHIAGILEEKFPDKIESLRPGPEYYKVKQEDLKMIMPEDLYPGD